MTKSFYLERALFVLGDKNTGKSTQMRSMFLDRRLGKNGVIPTEKNPPSTYYISNERRLYLRLTSPHERNESLKKFFDICEKRMRSPGRGISRWNFVGPLQLVSNNKNLIPDGVDVIKEFMDRFKPERTRAVILSPNCSGQHVDNNILLDHLDKMHKMDCEVILTDAQTSNKNGLIYSDFFDFT